MNNKEVYWIFFMDLYIIKATAKKPNKGKGKKLWN